MPAKMPQLNNTALKKIETPSSFARRVGASVIDWAVALCGFFLLHRALGLAPVPRPGWIAAGTLLLVTVRPLQRLLLGTTLGDAIWRPRNPEKNSVLERACAVFLTAVSVIASAWSMDLAIFKQPLWARAEVLELDAFLPDMASGQWEILPFFYTLGAWPKLYGGRPVFHSLPYEKGPPTRFAGHIAARWEEPQAQVTFEGPKTPDSPVATQKGEHTPRERIRDCLLGGSKSLGCLRIREATLLRHFEDMQKRLEGRSGGNTALGMKWKLEWFTVKNAALAPEDQAQGIRLSAEDSGAGSSTHAARRGEERYVLITENGTHQAIWLDYTQPGSAEAGHAIQLFGQAIRSLRASNELGPGRAWIDRRLESVKLDEQTPRSPAELAEIQALLVAKISVQPAVYDSYYHLGGTAILLDRLARQSGLAGSLEGLELAAVAKPLVQNTYRFAQDIAPNDPRTTQLQGFWFESQKP